MGWVKRGAMLPEIDDALFTLKPGGFPPFWKLLWGITFSSSRRKRQAASRPLKKFERRLAGSFSKRRPGHVLKNG
jgi:hypothetical protein